nr:reverse transcriptase domain-containing protein [Tanacetum cinerariifolium]
MPDESSPDASVVETPQEPWTLFTDGSSCVDGSGAGLILTSPEGTKFTYALRFQFTASYNEVEYEALITGLRIAAQMGMCNVHVSVDSKLVANQVLGAYVAKEENMIKYLEKVKSLVNGFANFSINQEGGKQTPYQGSTIRIVGRGSLQAVIPYVLAKMCRTTPSDYVIREIHEGSCSLHRRTTVHGGQSHTVGMLLDNHAQGRPGKVKFLIVAMDYFIKWIEAKAVVTITGNQVKIFVWDNIVCRFGLPGEIVSDNSK